MFRIMMYTSIFLFFAAKVNAQTETLTFGIVPQQSAKRLATLWTPIMQEVSQQSGVNVIFSTAKDIPTFEQRLAEGVYNIAYMNPYHYVTFSQKNGYRALAKQKNKSIKGVIVAKVGGDVSSIEDLRGAKLAFPAPAAFAASILPRAELKKHGIEFTPQYVSSHDSVYLNVSRGFFPAGGGIKRTLNNMPEKIKSSLITIWETQGYTPHAIATHPNIDQIKREKILAALLSMNHTEQGKKLLKSIGFNGFEGADDNSWNDVRALQLDNLVTSKNMEQ